jgi:putative transposase
VLQNVPLHLIQRGNNRQACFFADEDYRLYLDWLGKHAGKTGCRVHAYVLMTNHNGPEFVSRAVLKWLQGAGIETAFIEPGKPWQNGTAESLNGKFRDECLSMEWFRNRTEARVIIETWRRHYNEDRPHSSLGYRTPQQFKEAHHRKQQQVTSTHTEPSSTNRWS